MIRDAQVPNVNYPRGVKLGLSTSPTNKPIISFVGVAYQGKDIVFRFILEYSSLRDFGP